MDEASGFKKRRLDELVDRNHLTESEETGTECAAHVEADDLGTVIQENAALSWTTKGTVITLPLLSVRAAEGTGSSRDIPYAYILNTAEWFASYSVSSVTSCRLWGATHCDSVCGSGVCIVPSGQKWQA